MAVPDVAGAPFVDPVATTADVRAVAANTDTSSLAVVTTAADVGAMLTKKSFCGTLVKGEAGGAEVGVFELKRPTGGT